MEIVQCISTKDGMPFISGSVYKDLFHIHPSDLFFCRLRALSGGDGPEQQAKPVTTKRFKLAEFRYSKEDMLALVEENIKMPKELRDFGDVILQETQIQPLAFIPLSKDEEVFHNSNVLF